MKANKLIKIMIRMILYAIIIRNNRLFLRPFLRSICSAKVRAFDWSEGPKFRSLVGPMPWFSVGTESRSFVVAKSWFLVVTKSQSFVVTKSLSFVVPWFFVVTKSRFKDRNIFGEFANKNTTNNQVLRTFFTYFTYNKCPILVIREVLHSLISISLTFSSLMKLPTTFD
jgi:hypothetical protein